MIENGPYLHFGYIKEKHFIFLKTMTLNNPLLLKGVVTVGLFSFVTLQFSSSMKFLVQSWFTARVQQMGVII
jgi:hypothetical protein